MNGRYVVTVTREKPESSVLGSIVLGVILLLVCFYWR